jgi:hypothetical protein
MTFVIVIRVTLKMLRTSGFVAAGADAVPRESRIFIKDHTFCTSPFRLTVNKCNPDGAKDNQLHPEVKSKLAIGVNGFLVFATLPWVTS